MEAFNRKNHWEHIYQTKGPQEVSWYQARPDTSLHFIERSDMPLTAKIIDVGGGDGLLVDCLLASGYEDITVLDISATAIEKARTRLGSRADKVKWIVADIMEFEPEVQYDIWHDRAVFHFLVNDEDVEAYTETVSKSVASGGLMVVGTFSEQGPRKCSGIDIRQYSEATLTRQFEKNFIKKASSEQNHRTPFGTYQHFVFCVFGKR